MNPKDFREEFWNALQLSLPGEEAHLQMTPLSKSNFEQAKRDGISYRHSGVSVIFIENGKFEREIILIQRPEYEGKHSGQVSFPGGKKEPEDTSLLQTAIRECEEEIGVSLSEDDYLGALSPVYIPVSQFYVEPHVFFLYEKPEFEPDSYEVSEVFTIRVDDLLKEESRKLKNIKISDQISLKDVPYFDLENKIIWGATAVILNEVRAILLQLS